MALSDQDEQTTKFLMAMHAEDTPDNHAKAIKAGEDMVRERSDRECPNILTDADRADITAKGLPLETIRAYSEAVCFAYRMRADQ